ncbi:MAG: hypothetical protein WAK57_05140 [Desulfobacterales bacterium]
MVYSPPAALETAERRGHGVAFMAKAGMVEKGESVILVEGESIQNLHATESLKIISVCPKNQGGENLLPVVCGTPASGKQTKEPKP